MATVTTAVTVRKSPTAAGRTTCPPPAAMAVSAQARHGFTVWQMVELVRDGLTTAYTRRVIVAKRTVESHG
jgi:hypothetical protein